VCGHVGGVDRTSLSCAAESSDFIRFNHAQVRQATHVDQRSANISVVAGLRRATGSLTLSGNLAADTAALLAERDSLVAQLPLVPEDKYLLLPDTVSSTQRDSVAQLPALSREDSTTSSFGPEAYAVGLNFHDNQAHSSMLESTYLSDVNNDGLVDLVRDGSVLFNRLLNGLPVFAADGGAGTPVPIGPSVVATSALPADLNQLPADLDAHVPLIDTVRIWEAPYPGRVRVTGADDQVVDPVALDFSRPTHRAARIVMRFDACEH
jgi:hypothetical protein